MKFCPNCGSKESDNSRFCSECGTNLEGSGNVTNNVSTSQPQNQSNKKLFLGIGIGVLIVLVAFLIIPKIGGGEKPDKTVYNFFKAIQKGDIDSLLDSMSPTLKEMLIREGFSREDVLEELEYMNEEMVDEFGPNWPDAILIETISEDKGIAFVRITFEDESGNLKLVKDGKKWKIVDIPY